MSGLLDESRDPFSIFEAWISQARETEPNDPEAMALATSDANGLPDLRMVLMRGFDARGPVFYTNSQSAKGSQLAENAQACALFHWKSLRRQVRFRGPVEHVTEAESDAYFASRPRESRIGAWASQQSRPMDGRFALEKAVAREALRFGLGEVPRPAHWHGYRIQPLSIEFWLDKPFRLHDRLVFTRKTPDAPFTTEWLYP
jgi:pyridoxamine 5'-phosphate oxidase